MNNQIITNTWWIYTNFGSWQCQTNFETRFGICGSNVGKYQDYNPLLPSKWKQQIPPEHWYIPAQLHAITSQKTITLILKQYVKHIKVYEIKEWFNNKDTGNTEGNLQRTNYWHIMMICGLILKKVKEDLHGWVRKHPQLIFLIK
jgi:hypothetical protein